jgi:hypothetical protein
MPEFFRLGAYYVGAHLQQTRLRLSHVAGLPMGRNPLLGSATSLLEGHRHGDGLVELQGKPRVWLLGPDDGCVCVSVCVASSTSLEALGRIIFFGDIMDA